MSRVAKSLKVEANVAPTKLAEEKNSINLSAEAQMKLFELVLNAPSDSSENEDEDKEDTHNNLVRKAS